MIRCGSSNGVRVARPSANVSMRPRRAGARCHERYAAGAASDCTPITSIAGSHAPWPTMHAPAAPLPPPIGTTIDVDRRLAPPASPASRSRRRRSASARCRSGCSGSRARPRARSQCSRASSKSRPCTTSSAPRPRIAATLTGFARLGHADDRAHAEEPRGEGDRLAVVAGRGGDHAARPLLRGELRDEVDAAAHLEGADGLVVLVLDPDLRADQLARAPRSGTAASAAGTARCGAAPRARRRRPGPADR